jgi:flagellar motor switch protein FliN/FliY
MTNNQSDDKNIQPFSDAFFAALVAAMTAGTGSVWATVPMQDEGLASDGPGQVWIKCMLGGTIRGEFLLEFRSAEAAPLVSKLLQNPAGQFGAEQSEALKKLIDAAASKFHTTLEREYGTFTIETSSASEPLSERASVVQVTVADGDANRVSVSMSFNPELAESLLLHSRAVNSVAGTRGGMKVVAGNAILDPINLDLVMDVELHVTLRFGQRQLTLREVMDLTSGSVVELDRQVEEPVELLLNGTVIARGEAVVIDGNYGLRVTEVSQPVSTLTLH